MYTEKTRRLVTSGILVALSFILSLCRISPVFLYGGSVTLFSMVPPVVIGYLYGVRFGMLCGLVSGVLQGIMGASVSQAFAGLSPLSTGLMALLDYGVAFSVLGLGGLFRRMKNVTLSLTLGALTAGFLRYLAHFLSGYLLWSGYATWFFSEMFSNSFSDFILAHTSGAGLACIYSAVYNGLYMVPEILLTCLGTVLLSRVPPIRRMLHS